MKIKQKKYRVFNDLMLYIKHNHDVNHEDFSKLLGVAPCTLSGLRHGRKTWQQPLMFKACDVFNEIAGEVIAPHNELHIIFPLDGIEIPQTNKSGSKSGSNIMRLTAI